MKKQAVILVIITGFLLIVGQAFAGSFTVGDQVTLVSVAGPHAYVPGYGYAGEIKLKSGDAILYTFCLEANENLGSQTTVTGVDFYADQGGIGGVQLVEAPDVYGDPLSSASQWLYRDYLAKRGGPNAYNTGSLQLAFWVLEEEFDQKMDPWVFFAQNAKNAGLIEAAQGYVGLAQQSAGDEYYGVKVLNLLNNRDQTKAQSVLIPVPEPGVMMLLALGVFGVGLAYRKMN